MEWLNRLPRARGLGRGIGTGAFVTMSASRARGAWDPGVLIVAHDTAPPPARAGPGLTAAPAFAGKSPASRARGAWPAPMPWATPPRTRLPRARGLAARSVVAIC